MHVDYTHYFSTPEELVLFLLLDAEEQDALLAEKTATVTSGNTVMVCDIPVE